MGGYLGLLLGASAITVVELIDLFIYNSLLRFMQRNRVDAAESNKQAGNDNTMNSSKEAILPMPPVETPLPPKVSTPEPWYL